MKRIKHIKVIQSCKACKTELFKQNLIVPVPEDFKVSDISEQVLRTIVNVQCAAHPTAFLNTTYTYFHEEILR